MRIFQYSVILMLSILLFTCANPRYPSGGPQDIIPPKIVESYPLTNTVNFEENFISFTFSEYVDKNSFREAVFFSPAIDGEIEYDWSGTTVEIIFHDGLKENTTYSVSVGTDVKDVNNNNKMLNAGILSFSTGDKIDKGIISGKVYGNNYSGSMIFAYKNFPDTLNPSNQKPDYVSQVSEDGKFLLLGLSEGNYRVLAVKDDFKDLLYQTEEDMYGCLTKDLSLEVNDSSNTNLKFLMTREDTSKPHISSVTMVDKYHLIAEFSENIDSSKIDVEQFAIIDTSNNRSFSPKYFHKGKNASEYTFIIQDTLTENEEYSFRTGDFYDKANNKSGNEIVTFIASSRVDTNKVKLKKVITAISSGEIDNLDPFVVLEFDDALVNDSFHSIIKIEKAGKLLNNINFQKIDDSRIRLNILERIRLKDKFTVIVESGELYDIAGNVCDSIKNIELQVIDGLDFSGASGVVNSGRGNLKIVLQEAEYKNSYQTNIEHDKTFNFTRIKPGKYLLWIYEDSDSNSNYNYGSVFPFAPSENFTFYPDTIDLKARWPVGDIQINF